MLLSTCFCKETDLAAYLSIKLAAKTSSSSSCNCASCNFGFGRLTHSSFMLVLTDTTFLLFFISHIDNTCIADSGAPYTHLPRNSFLILFICVWVASFWHFLLLFSVCHAFSFHLLSCSCKHILLLQFH